MSDRLRVTETETVFTAGEPIGFVVAIVNQASGQPEDLTSSEIYADRGEADKAADDWGRYTAGRYPKRDRYVVCAVVPVSQESR